MPGPDVEERKMSVQKPHSVLLGPKIRLTQAIPISPSSQSIFLTMNNLETIRIPTNTLANVKKTSVTANTASPLLMVDYSITQEVLRCQASCAGGCGVDDFMVPSDWYSCKVGSHCDGIVNLRDLVQLARDLVELPRTKL